MARTVLVRILGIWAPPVHADRLSFFLVVPSSSSGFRRQHGRTLLQHIAVVVVGVTYAPSDLNAFKGDGSRLCRENLRALAARMIVNVQRA